MSTTKKTTRKKAATKKAAAKRTTKSLTFSQFADDVQSMRKRLDRIDAKFDATTLSPNNRRHWANAGSDSPVSALTSSERKTQRDWCRYEIKNNPVAYGVAKTIAENTVGRGPRLSVAGVDPDISSEISARFEDWMCDVGLAWKLRLLRETRIQSGEVFAVFVHNDAIDNPVGLDVVLFEPDYVDSDFLDKSSNGFTGGIKYNQYGSPLKYRFAKAHPAGSSATLNGDKIVVDAADVIHYFRADRPGQLRGIPDMLPALPTLAVLRRFELATVEAAETAANFGFFITTNSPANGEAASCDAAIEFEVCRNAGIPIPDGWGISQLKAEHPGVVHDAYVRQLISMAFRCMQIPGNVARLDSGQHNMASGRLDITMYNESLRIERDNIEKTVLRRIFRKWFDQAVLVSGYLSDRAKSSTVPLKIQWFWDSFPDPDPVKSANATATKLAAGVTTLAHEWGANGVPIGDALNRLESERAELAKRGISVSWDNQQQTGGN